MDPILTQPHHRVVFAFGGPDDMSWDVLATRTDAVRAWITEANDIRDDIVDVEVGDPHGEAWVRAILSDGAELLLDVCECGGETCRTVSTLADVVERVEAKYVGENA